MASQWWQDPNYTHGFFVPVFSLFLLWERRAKLAALRIKPAWSGLVILLFALMTLVVGTIKSGFFLYRVSVLLFIAGLGGLSCRMETSGGDFVSPGISGLDDSFSDIGGADHLSAADHCVQDCEFSAHAGGSARDPGRQHHSFAQRAAWRWRRPAAESGRSSRCLR